MSHSISEQLCFLPAVGFTIQFYFNGGELSSDLRPLLLREVDRQMGRDHCDRQFRAKKRGSSFSSETTIRLPS